MSPLLGSLRNSVAIATFVARVSERHRWINREQFVRRLTQADPRLATDLAELVPDTTDDLPQL